MSASILPFRVLPEHLSGLDGKTREGLAPLLEALNVTLQQLVAAAANTTPGITAITSSFSTDENGSAYVDMKFAAGRPAAVSLDALRRRDLEPIATVFSWTWQMAGELVRVLFVGLDTVTTFDFTLSMR